MSSEIYTCPMHPGVRQAIPGICPECGMNLIADSAKRKMQSTDHSSHERHAGHSIAMFARKFWASLVLTIPVVAAHFGQFRGARYLSFLFGSIVFFYGGWVFLTSARRELAARLPGMMTLIALAISVAYGYSAAVFFGFPGEPLFWELTTLITIMLLGHLLEMKAVQGAQGALKELTKLLPDKAELINQNSKIEEVSISQLKEDDLILVRPGGKIPADGEVAEGNSEVDEALMTGESRPVGKNVGDAVIAGTINGDGSLKIRVTQIGEKTFLAGVMRLVAEAQASKSRLQILSDRAAFYLTIIALTIGIGTFVVWLLARATPSFALERLVAVLVIACPHALGLAVPLVASISTTMAARRGFLVRKRLALEAARNIDVTLFDKTGTLTRGEFGLEEIFPISKIQFPKSKLLQLAASVDAHSEHPIARAIVKKAQEEQIELLPVKDFQRIPGKGAKGQIDNEEVMVGSEAIFTPTSNSSPVKGEEKPPGKTVIYVAKDKELIGSIALTDTIRDESRGAIETLKGLGIKTAMITGDSEDVAKWVAGELGIEEYFARVLPEEKAEKVKILQNRGLKVAFVGDGVNDAPALTQADLGIAIGAGTNVAIESAGIILVKNDPRDIAKIVRLSQLTYRKMIQNLFWATGYNVVALPLAAGVLATKGIILEPALAAVLMSVSTVIVALNALLLRKVEL